MDWVFWTNWTTNFFYLFWIISLSCTLVTLLWVLAGKLFEKLGYFTMTGFLLKGMMLFWLLFSGYEVLRWWEQDERNLFVYKGGFVPERWMEVLGYIFGVIWISGVVAGLIIYLYRIYRINCEITKAFPCDRNIMRIFEQVKKEYKIRKKHIMVRCSYAENGARTARVFRPVILLPAQNFSEKELFVIFRHELMHIKKHDLFYKNLAEILCRIYFLNPFVWWLKKQLDRWIEYVCDYKVCKKYGDIKNYYGTILNFAENSVSSPALVSSLAGKKSQLYDRMQKIIKNSRPKKTSKILAAVLLLMLFAGTNAVYVFAMESGETFRLASAANAVKVPLDNAEDAAEHLLSDSQTERIPLGEVTEEYLETKAVIYDLDWTLSGHERMGMFVRRLEQGDYIRFYAGGITNGKRIKVILIQPDHSLRYVEMEAGMVHIFHIKESGNYQFYLENTEASPMRVLGGCTVFHENVL